MVRIAVKATIGITVSLTIMITYSFLLGVEFSDVLRIGLLGFILAGILNVSRLIVQGLRFHILVKAFGGGINFVIHESVLTRVASEFIALISPSYFGGEALRVAWLKSKGVDIGRAAWTSFTELFLDVIVGTSITITVGIYLFLIGEYFGSIIILLVATPILVFYIGISLLSSRKQIRIPKIAQNFLIRFVGTERGEYISKSVESAGKTYTQAAKEFFENTPKNTLALALIFTFILTILGGTTLWVVFKFMGFNVDIIWSIAALCVALTIGTIPISPGGSGLMEIGLSLITPVAIGTVAWSAVIVWRIIYYYIGIGVTGMALIILLVTKPEIYKKALKIGNS